MCFVIRRREVVNKNIYSSLSDTEREKYLKYMESKWHSISVY